MRRAERYWWILQTDSQFSSKKAAIVAYIVVAASGEPLGKWTITLILAIAFVAMGMIGAIDYVKSNKTQK